MKIHGAQISVLDPAAKILEMVVFHRFRNIFFF